MADDKTEHFGNGSSFEDRIMARFDAMIMAVGKNVKEMKVQLSVRGEDVLSVRAKQREADLRLRELESFQHRA